MYEFVDTIEPATQNTRLSLTTVFGGVSLDDALSDNDGSFITLTVDGRGVANRLIRTFDRSGDGIGEIDTLLDVREITVKYKLQDKTNEDFRYRFNDLNRLLIGSKKTLEFTDETKFFYATLSGGDLPEEDSNHMIGSIVFTCTDPFKYSMEKSINLTTVAKTEQINGHTSTTWKTRTLFSTAQSNYTFEFSQGGKTDLREINKIRLNYNFVAGDVLKIDYKRRLVTVNDVDITNTVVILQSNFMELPIGEVDFKTSHKTEVVYNERFY